MARTDERFRQAYNQLLDRCEGMEPGESLAAETLLAEDLDVSRTVVRAALERMRDEGIIRWEGREKTILRPPQASDRVATSASAVSDEELEHAELFAQNAAAVFLLMKPFNDFLNQALEGFHMPERG